MPSKQAHPVATYGLIFDFGFSLALISDTKYFPALEQLYKADVLIINVVFMRKGLV